ncbi:MAG TPA: hypothetical protein VGW40_04725 [Allosphingosinicella sp.]|nr:hypothetical protein [Allosphingosinicella sp.]
METDRAYYARRAEEQKRAAARAADAEARRRHLELAALLAARERAASHP